MWSLFDPKALTPSWEQLEPVLTALVQSRHQISAGVAANYYSALRAAMHAPGRFVPTPSGLLAADDVVPWLRAAGPTTAVDLFNAGRASEVSKLALQAVSGSIERMVLDGGRETVATATETDPQAIGYIRVAGPDACSFCAMLGAGNIYTSAEHAGEGNDWHNGCNCGTEPVFSRRQTLPETVQRYKSLWNETTRGLSGNDARIAFRQAVEGRTPPTSDLPPPVRGDGPQALA